MEADIILNNSSIEIIGNINVTADEGELTVNGNTSGYAFFDRLDKKTRFVLYAVRNQIHFYKDGIGNILTIEDKSITVEKLTTTEINTDSLTVFVDENPDARKPVGPRPFPYINRKTPIDVGKTILELRKRIEQLEARINK